MKRDSASSHLLKGIIFVVFIILFVKLFWIVTEWYLPLESVEVESGKGESGLYYRYRLASEKVKKPPKRVTKPKKRAPTIKELKLVGIYHDSVNDIAVVRKNGKDVVLVAGEKINGFTLKAVGEKEAWFERDGKSYELELFEDKRGKKEGYEIVRSSPAPSKLPLSKEKKGGEEGAPDDIVSVDRQVIEEYTKNLDKIWKDISITDLRKDGKVTGFRVRYIRRGSFFDRIGLKRGDTITAINGRQVTDYSVPMNLLKNIETLENLTLTIERRGRSKELEYEIE
jgi:general secretion pathway protein C